MGHSPSHIGIQLKWCMLRVIAMCSLSTPDLTKLSLISNEEADTRVFMHIAHVVHKGCLALYERTVDTYSHIQRWLQ